MRRRERNLHHRRGEQCRIEKCLSLPTEYAPAEHDSKHHTESDMEQRHRGVHQQREYDGTEDESRIHGAVALRCESAFAYSCGHHRYDQDRHDVHQTGDRYPDNRRLLVVHAEPQYKTVTPTARVLFPGGIQRAQILVAGIQHRGDEHRDQRDQGGYLDPSGANQGPHVRGAGMTSCGLYGASLCS